MSKTLTLKSNPNLNPIKSEPFYPLMPSKNSDESVTRHDRLNASSMLDEVEEGRAEPHSCQNTFGDFTVDEPEQLVEIQKLRMKGGDGFCQEEMFLLVDLELRRIPLRPPTAFLNVCWNVMLKCLAKLTVRNLSIRFVLFLFFFCLDLEVI